MGQNYFKFLNGNISVDIFQKDMLHNINMFAKNMENLKHGEETKRQWMDMFLRWCEWGTEMDDEYWGE